MVLKFEHTRMPSAVLAPVVGTTHRPTSAECRSISAVLGASESSRVLAEGIKSGKRCDHALAVHRGIAGSNNLYRRADLLRQGFVALRGNGYREDIRRALIAVAMLRVNCGRSAGIFSFVGLPRLTTPSEPRSDMFSM
jgi:hypothetical protein